jgi:hypothetical protein
MQWGAAEAQPLVLGSNAPGFLHAFAGTSGPVNIGVGKLNARVLWGRLEQSDYTLNTGDAAVRFGTGAVAVLQPRGFENLELGLTRFYHMRWKNRDFLRAIDPFWKETIAERPDTPVGGQDPDNQVASVFFRLLLADAGLEVFGEFYREDHNWNLRDALLEPDHAAAYSLGLRRSWLGEAGAMHVLRGEVLNAEPSHLRTVRQQNALYLHAGTRQGHTNRGQALGATAAVGGRGASFGWDAYSPAGRWTVQWERELRAPARSYEGPSDPRGPDVAHALGVEVLRFVRGYEVTAGITAVNNFNRRPLGDAFNLRAAAGVRAAF